MRFEWLKYPVKKWVPVLILIPAIVMAAMFFVSGDNSVTFKRQEIREANEMLSEFQWRRGMYQSNIESGYLILDTPEKEAYYEELFEIVDQAERARYIYSADTYYENWENVNEARYTINQLLIELTDMGERLSTVEPDTLYSRLAESKWQYDYQIGPFIFESQRDSIFLTHEVLGLLASGLAIMLFIYFFALPTFREYTNQTYRFSQTLPLSRTRSIGSKFTLVSILYLIIILSLGITIFAMSVWTDQIPLIAQLNYPVTFELGELFVSKPMWIVLIYQVLMYYLVTMISLGIILLLNRRFRNELFTIAIFFSLMTFSNQMSIIFDWEGLWWNPLNWFNIKGMSYVLTDQEAILSILLALMTLGVLLFIIFRWGLIPLQERSSRNKRSLPINALSFDSRFEALKFKRSNRLLYLFLAVTLFILYFSVQGYLERTSWIDEYHNQLITEMEFAVEEQEMIREELVGQDVDFSVDPRDQWPDNVTIFDLDFVEIRLGNYHFYQDEINRAQDLIDELEQGTFDNKLAYDKNLRENDVAFFTDNTVYSFHIPMQNTIFAPNALINLELINYIENNNIKYPLPFGPYNTLFIPEYETSPRSGEGEPPSSIDVDAFEQYLEAVSTPLAAHTGDNQIQNFLSSYSYLILYGVIAIFLSIAYALDWESRSIRLSLAQPQRISTHFNGQVNATVMTIIDTVIFSLILLYIGGLFIEGPGQWEFPFVRYYSKTLGDANPEGILRIAYINQYYTIEPMWRYVLEGGLLLTTGLIFVNELAYFFSSIVRTTWGTLILLISTLGLGIWGSLTYIHQFMAASPFIYLNVPGIIEGTFAQQMDYPWVNTWVGIGILLIWSLLVRLVSQTIVNRRRYI